jgi:hypothetical protein
MSLLVGAVSGSDRRVESRRPGKEHAMPPRRTSRPPLHAATGGFRKTGGGDGVTQSGRGVTTRLTPSATDADNEREVLTFSDLLPTFLHDATLRDRLARLYAAYRSLDVWCLADDAAADREIDAEEARLQDVAALNVAVVEGLGLQQQVDPEGFSSDGPYELWERMIELYLDTVSAQGSVGESQSEGSGATGGARRAAEAADGVESPDGRSSAPDG